MRLGRDHRAHPDPAPGDLERRRALAARGRILEQGPRLLPPRPAVARAEIGEPRRVLRHLLAVRAAELVENRASAVHQHGGERDGSAHREHAAGPERVRTTPLDGHLDSCRGVGGREDDCGADREEDPEPRAVVDPGGVRLEIVGDRRSRKRPDRDKSGHGSCHDERAERLEPIALDRQPGERRKSRDEDSGARKRENRGNLGEVDEHRSGCAHGSVVSPGSGEPQAERNRGRCDERKRVPVADRVAEPGDPETVGNERRHDLPGQRPEQHESDQHGEAAGDRARGSRYPRRQQPEHGEHSVDECPIERLPRAIRGNRPPHRQADPGGERADQREAQETRSARYGNPPGAERDGRRQQRQRADPEQAARRRSVAEEQGDEEQRAGGEKGRRPSELGGGHRRATLAQRLPTRSFTDT